MQEFRFLVICQSVERNGTKESLHGVLSMVNVSQIPTTLPAFAAVGLILMPEMPGHSLDLMFWRLDKNGTRQKVPGFVGMPLILPDSLGPVCCPYKLNLPIPEPGIYGFDLFDPNGVFGNKAGLLATYMFSVDTLD